MVVKLSLKLVHMRLILHTKKAPVSVPLAHVQRAEPKTTNLYIKFASCADRSELVQGYEGLFAKLADEVFAKESTCTASVVHAHLAEA